MRAIVTLCDGKYQPLLKKWVTRVTDLTAIPVYVIAFRGFSEDGDIRYRQVDAAPAENLLDPNSWEYGLSEKLRLFTYLPDEVMEILFIDVDVLLLHNFWESGKYFVASRRALVVCQDFYVGYKEKLEDEFRSFDPSFRMKFYTDGTFRYFNTGVFFASRRLHAPAFHRFFDVGREYVTSQGCPPSLFDQNLTNYCLIREHMRVKRMPIGNNCLRQYNPTVINGQLVFNGAIVNAYHLNGGEPSVKMERWEAIERKLEGMK